jgi:hypothetical protein
LLNYIVDGLMTCCSAINNYDPGKRYTPLVEMDFDIFLFADVQYFHMKKLNN